MKKLKKWMWIVLGVCLSSILLSTVMLSIGTKNHIYSSINTVPHNKVGLVLGTSKHLTDGRLNLFYLYRIEAAIQLFKAGKIDFILASGDNGSKYYDEPSSMKEDLITKGIPASKIYLDYAGFRTLDSVVRSKAIFGQDRITVISQQFHNERAVFIARWKGIEAIGYNATDIGGDAGLKVKLRESLARVKMILDLLIGKEPKFYGKEIEIE